MPNLLAARLENRSELRTVFEDQAFELVVVRDRDHPGSEPPPRA